MEGRELEGLSMKLKDARFGPLLYWLEELFSFEGSPCGSKNFFKYFSKK